MKLSRLRLEQFKRFREPFEIRDLEPGLNLFVGPNEAGKSTLVEAIRAAFFERHRSSSVQVLRPRDEPTAAPTVELEFVIGAQHYRLVKSFLNRKRCVLEIGSRQLDSDEAEDHLAELLGFRFAGRGASGAEHWGIPGLLWIQQGTAQELRDSVIHATDQLRTALTASLGEVVSSSGDGILEAVETLRNDLLTPAGGRPRGDYAEALTKAKNLADDILKLDADITAYRHKVDTLASLRRDQAAAEAEKPWVAFREQARVAADRLRNLVQIEETLDAERQRQSQLESRLDWLRAKLDSFAQQEKAADSRKAALVLAKEQHATANGRVEQCRSQHGDAVRQHEAARDTLRQARTLETRRNLDRERETLRRKLEDVSTRLAKAEAENARLRDLQIQANGTAIALKDLEALRTLDREIRELGIRLTTAATGVRFALEDGRSIQIGAETVSGTGTRQVFDTTVVRLPGLGTLDITPGGTDLAQLRGAKGEAEDRRDALLLQLGLASLDAAEVRHEAHTQCRAELKTAEATLQALAPEGLDALRVELAGVQSRAGEIEQALASLPPEAESGNALPAVAAAETAEDTARKRLTEWAEQLQAAQLAAGQAQTALDNAARERACTEALLTAPGRAEDLAATQRDLAEARAQQTALTERIRGLIETLQAARPELLKQDVERFEKSAEQEEKSFAERRDALLKLDVELQTTGAKGLEERRAEKAQNLAHTQRRVEEFRRRAEAADYLLRLLREKRQALTRRLQAPLQKHLNHYLHVLFPGAQLEIDEALTPGPLLRQGTHRAELGDFDALSFGAREQMGVISRLAYAGLLKDAGRPTLIILDDALVHSDADRLQSMKRILFDAASRHQILLFTCHPEKWRDLGVRARSLAGT